MSKDNRQNQIQHDSVMVKFLEYGTSIGCDLYLDGVIVTAEQYKMLMTKWEELTK